ncbi:ABC transporter substrate-binding protein [Amycolatopsis sp. YIM 10]|uniref:ABC transporter substrate-binding protein n=1 Tax=Amycolatopsis sp. YIM 10 TaxID=2653857 RepID=UPI001290707D|nr:ABC transporter substrate-binding protein [Amycolatopsis sp. YIM 10]QFU88309.1 Fe(3+)-citrate-binding protein YfmC precursor [Amycolatopsis sp. YIM 10]
MRRTGTLGAAFAALALTLSACAGGPAESAGAAPPAAVDRAVAPLEPSLRITDPHGRELALTAPPQRIVCLSGLCDDLTTELGIVPAGTSNPRLLGHPVLLGDAGASVPVVRGSFGSEDVESIAALKPDLVIGLSGVHDGLTSTVGQFAPLWLTEPKTWQESVGYLRNLGALTGRVEEAKRAEERFRAMLADTVDKRGQQGTAVLMYGSVDAIGVDNADSLKGDLLAHLFNYPFPAKNSDVDTASNYSVEELLARQPDVIFVYSLLFTSDAVPLSRQLADNPVWREIPAVKTGAVHEMNPDLWGKGRGTRSLTAIVREAVDKAPAA